MYLKFLFTVLVVCAFKWSTCEEEDCNFPCPMNYDPKCGSDGVIYGNSCALDGEICRNPIGVIEEPLINCVNKICPDNCAEDDEICKEIIKTCRLPYKGWLQNN